MNPTYDLLIIGTGIVGLGAAYQLQQKYPHLRLLIVDKEPHAAAHQSGHNSGVIHSGVYYKPGSLRATNCTSGYKLLLDFAKNNNIKHDICGKVIVATHQSELPRLEKIYQTGIENGLAGTEIITTKQLLDIEPYCNGIAALWVPQTGIINYIEVAEKMATILVQKYQTTIKYNCEVRGFTEHTDFTEVATSQGAINAKYIINCSGHQTDRLTTKHGADPEMQIVGFRGDYYDLTEAAQHKVKNLIYPVPDPQFPFLGVHFTRMIEGGVECGPNAVFAFKREGYNKTDFDFNDTIQALTYRGTWNLFRKHWRYGLDEYKRAFSKRLFLQNLQRLIPSLTTHDIVPARAGVRAVALAPDGDAIDDFKIVTHRNALHILSTPSPAATAALSIGNALVEMAEDAFQLK